MRVHLNRRPILWAPAMALLLAASAFADRHKASIDPESEDGVLLQRIQQERSPQRRQALLEEYAMRFPKSASVAWVYEQLVHIYKDAKDNQRVLVYANALLAADPNDLDSANDALRAAEESKATEMIRIFAERAWDLGNKAAGSPKPADPAEAGNWSSQVDFAHQVMTYAEFVLATEAANEPDAAKRNALIQALVTRNPQSKYLANTRKQSVVELASADPDTAVRIAEQGLATDPDNEEFLLTVAYYDLGHEKDLPKVLQYSLRILELMRKRAKPVSLTPQEWEKKKGRFTGWANWMAGVVYGRQSRYALSDKHLRASLPAVRDEPGMLAAAYFYLGYDNYVLAGELRDLSRAVEAAKFSKLCAAMESPFRALAQKNLKSLKTDYNVE